MTFKSQAQSTDQLEPGLLSAPCLRPEAPPPAKRIDSAQRVSSGALVSAASALPLGWDCCSGISMKEIPSGRGLEPRRGMESHFCSANGMATAQRCGVMGHRTAIPPLPVAHTSVTWGSGSPQRLTATPSKALSVGGVL